MLKRLNVEFRALVALVGVFFLSGCYTFDRLGNLGDAPSSTPIKDPTKLPNYHPVTMPMPEPEEPVQRVNSLWQTGARGFFKDQRAKNRGDILTVDINISSQSAKIESKTKRERKTQEQLSIPNFLGYEGKLKNVLPSDVDPSNLITASNDPKTDSTGHTERSEDMQLKIAATIVQILPNGNYVIQGHQEMRVNFEMREIGIVGIVRPEDIDSTNTVKYEKIAEARIIYGGRGNIMDFQQPAWGQQLLGLVAPF